MQRVNINIEQDDVEISVSVESETVPSHQLLLTAYEGAEQAQATFAGTQAEEDEDSESPPSPWYYRFGPNGVVEQPWDGSESRRVQFTRVEASTTGSSQPPRTVADVLNIQNQAPPQDGEGVVGFRYGWSTMAETKPEDNGMTVTETPEIIFVHPSDQEVKLVSHDASADYESFGYQLQSTVEETEDPVVFVLPDWAIQAQILKFAIPYIDAQGVKREQLFDITYVDGVPMIDRQF